MWRTRPHTGVGGGRRFLRAELTPAKQDWGRSSAVETLVPFRRGCSPPNQGRSKHFNLEKLSQSRFWQSGTGCVLCFFPARQDRSSLVSGRRFGAAPNHFEKQRLLVGPCLKGRLQG